MRRTVVSAWLLRCAWVLIVAAVVQPVAAQPADYAEQSTPSAPAVSMQLSGVELGDAVRYTLSIENMLGAALPGATVTLELPADAELLEAFETAGRTRLVQRGPDRLVWAATGLASGAHSDPFTVLLRAPTDGEFIASVSWEGDVPGQSSISRFPRVVRATGDEGVLTLQANGPDVVAIGDTGVRVGVLAGDATGATIRVRRLDTLSNLTDELGAFWWCAVVEVDGLPDGAALFVVTPARRALAPDSAISLFAAVEGGWQALTEPGMVTGDAQFVGFVHRGGALAAGTTPIAQPKFAALGGSLGASPDMAIAAVGSVPAAEVAPSALLTVPVTITNVGSATSADGLVVSIAGQAGLALASAQPVQPAGTACTAASASNVTCVLPSLASNQQVQVSATYVAPVSSDTQVCITATVQHEPTDSDPTNDAQSRCVRVTNAVERDLAITVSPFARSALSLGGAATYRMTVAALQGASSGSVTASLTYDSALQGVTVSADGWSCLGGGDAGFVVCNRSDPLVAPSAYPSINITGTLVACANPLVRRATLTFQDSNAGNNTSAASDAMTCPVLAVSLVATVDPLDNAHDEPWGVLITNSGPIPTSGPLTIRLTPGYTPTQVRSSGVTTCSVSGPDIVCQALVTVRPDVPLSVFVLAPFDVGSCATQLPFSFPKTVTSTVRVSGGGNLGAASASTSTTLRCPVV